MSVLLQEIQERIPNDPLEAELLMMAEAVAGKDDESSSESEEEQPEGKISTSFKLNFKKDSQTS